MIIPHAATKTQCSQINKYMYIYFEKKHLRGWKMNWQMTWSIKKAEICREWYWWKVNWDYLQNPGKLSGIGVTGYLGRQRQGWGYIKDSCDTTYLLYPVPGDFYSPSLQEKRKCTLEELSTGGLGTQRHSGLTENKVCVKNRNEGNAYC